MKTRLNYIFITLTLLAIGNVARSATITWTNAAGGSWNTAANWDPNQVPGSGDSASIPGGVNVLIDATNSAGGFTLGQISSSSSLTVATNGVLNIEGGVVLDGVLTNQGTVNWQAGSVTIYYDGVTYLGEIWNQAGAMWNIQCDQTMNNSGWPQFHNAGTVVKSAGTGTTSFTAYCANSGSVQAQNGTIQFNAGGDLGGSFQADSGAAIYFAGGTFTLSGAPNFQGPGAVQLISGANVTLNGLVGPLTLNGATLMGQSTVYGTLNLFGGGLGQISSSSSLTVATNGVLNIEGGVVLDGVLTNQGTVNWQAGSVTIYYDGVTYLGEIWNQAGAMWNIQCDQTMNNSGWPQFHNAGTVVKSAGTGTTSFTAYCANSGSVHAQSGTIQFNAGSDLGGSFQADSGAAIYFAGGGYTFSGAQNFQGPGQVGINGVVAPNGILSGTLAMYNGGGIAAGSSLTIATNGVLNIEGGVVLDGVLTNQGTVNWQAGSVTIYYDGVTYLGEIWNQAGAMWNIQCDQTMNNSGWPQFHNAGTVVKSAGTGTTSFTAYCANSGSVQAQNGIIQFNGGYAETSSASQVIGIGGISLGSGYGQIAFSSSPTFAGSFNVTLLNGFQPSPGNSFPVLSYPSLSGSFTSMNGLDLGNGLHLVPQFGNTGLTLVAAGYSTTARPSLSLYRTPNGVLAWWPLSFIGWQLEMTTNLATHIWAPLTVAGTNNNVVVPQTAPHAYFRLHN